MNKYFVYTTRANGDEFTETVYSTSKEQVLKDYQEGRVLDKTGKPKKAVAVFSAEGKHVCQYCGSVTDGTNEDVLCPDCHEIFGHYLYSEL